MFLRTPLKGFYQQMGDGRNQTLALFYCRRVPGSGEQARLTLEKEHGKSIRLFPIPCSGRLDPVHMLKALEQFADAAYLITCPKGACRYFEGNYRAEKRVERTRAIITSIGLEPERVGILIGSKDNPKPLAELAREIFGSIFQLGPSPVFKFGSSPD